MDQGELDLLEDPAAQDLLSSSLPAHFAYNWRNGSPRVVPMWFNWDGRQLVFGTPARAPKLKALADQQPVAVTIDDASTFPYRQLTIRGTVEVRLLEDVVPEYASAALRYFGPEHGPEWLRQLAGKPMARIAVTPTWVGLLDFQSRFPSALS